MEVRIPDNAPMDELQRIKAEAEAWREALEELAKVEVAKKTLAAAKSNIGEIPASGTSGSVDVGDGAGAAEAMLLGVVAVNAVSNLMAERIKRDLPETSKQLMLFPSAAVPDFQALTAYTAQFSAIKAAFEEAQKSTPDVGMALSADAAGASSLPLPLPLNAIIKLLAFLKTDYKFVGIDVDSSDAMLVSALARSLSSQEFKVEIPGTFVAGLKSSPSLDTEIEAIYGWSAEASRSIRQHQDEISRLEKQLKDRPDDQDAKEELQKERQSLALWKRVSDAIDGWTKQFLGTDDPGNVALAMVIKQRAIRDALEGGATLIVVQLYKVAGSAYTKKSLLSLIGCSPFFVMGGAVAGYTALDGKSGEVLSSMLAPWHGGFHSVFKVRDHVNRAER